MQAGDILLHENTSHDPVSILMRWAIGKYTHASMYAGKQFNPKGYDEYCIFESIGVGPTLTPLSACTGKYALLIQMPLTKRDRIVLVAKARQIADSPLYQYGYDDVLFQALPTAIARKFRVMLHLPDPTVNTQICNKAVGLVYLEAGIRSKLPPCIALPPDLLLTKGAIIRGGIIGKDITW